MKKLSALLGSAVLAAALAVHASAASADPALIFVDGEQLSGGAPFSASGATFVPFRAIFQELGLQVGWDAKTQKVTGKKNGLTIELTLGSKTAKVNGAAQTMIAAPISKGNAIYVPLRFIGQAAGAAVNWDAESGVIEIETAEAKQQAKADITAVLKKMAADYTKKDTAAYLTAMTSTDDYDVSGMEEFFKASDFTNIVTGIEFEYLDSYSAVVSTTEESRWTGGEYFPDTEDTYEYTLYKEEGGWKVDEISMIDSYEILPSKAPTAQASPEVDQAVKAVVEDYTNAVNNKNWEGILATFVPYDDQETLNEDKEAYAKRFEANFKITPTNTQYLYSDDNFVVLYAQKSITFSNESEKNESEKIISIIHLEKQSSGKWLISWINSFDDES